MRILIFLLGLVLVFTGCADSVPFTLAKELEVVGFWYGLWHGVIAPFAFIVSLFDESVSMYALYNNGGWYDFGFLLGVISIWGGSCKMKCRSKSSSAKDKEWEEIGAKVELKIMHRLKEWAEDDDIKENTQEWDDVSKKVEKKLKRKIREWAEKE